MPASKPTQCNRGCGQMLYFDRNDPVGTSQSGKPVPLEWDNGPSGIPHNCPNNPYNANRGGGQQQQRQQPTTDVGAKVGNVQIEALLGNTMDIIARVEKLDRKFDEVIKAISTIANRGDPLDDDGDSQRENPQQEPEA